MPRRSRRKTEPSLTHDPVLDMRLERLAGEDDVDVPYRARKRVAAEIEKSND